MKLFTAIFFSIILVPLHGLLAQDASVVPLPDTLPPQTPDQPMAQPSATPLSLIPNAPEPVGKPAYHSSHDNGGDRAGGTAGAFNPVKKNKTDTNTDDIAERIKFRVAKTKALRDDKVQELAAQVDSAKTDVDKRAALKSYYTVLYAKILKFDGSIKKLVSQRLQDSLKGLDQSRVRPEDYPQQASAAH